MEGTGRSYRRYIIPAICAALALAGIVAYCMSRSGGRSGENIGQEAAKTAALAHAGVSEADLSRYEIALDESGGAPVYRVEFETESCAYDYAVSAGDGSIVKFSRETDGGGTPAQPDRDDPSAAPTGTDGYIGEARAWEIAYAHAGVTADSAARPQWKLDSDDGVSVYELEFYSGGYEYDYEINAVSGEVVKYEREPEPAAPVSAPQNGSGTPSAPAAPSPEGITETGAKEIALNHAGVTADSIANYKWKLDFDDGISVYELEFNAGGYAYEYEINAADGAVIKFEKETDRSAAPAQTAQTTETPASGDYIGEARAWEIAFSHAGVAAGSAAHCSIELDHERHHSSHSQHHESNCCTYEVDFHCGGYEYEYKIDALTGSILDFEQEVED